MHRSVPQVAVLLLALGTTVNAATISFLTDPFAGSTALTTPGRQIVGGEPFVSFSVASDVFLFDPAIFGVGSQVLFANNTAGNLPTSGVNVVVLQTTDDDANAATPFGAGSAANLIANQITSPGPGFFIYFNSGLNLPRLVFSTDLNENTADLKILARMTNLAGDTSALATFTSSNFQMIPEPSSFILMTAAGVLSACAYAVRRRRSRG